MDLKESSDRRLRDIDNLIDKNLTEQEPLNLRRFKVNMLATG